MINSFGDIIERLKRIKGYQTDSEVAEALSMSKQALYNHKMRGTIPFKAITDYCKLNKISLGKVFLPARSLEVIGRAPASSQEEGEEIYITNEGYLSLDIICDQLGIKPNEFDKWFRTHKKESSSDSRLKKIVEAIKKDETLKQIVYLLDNDAPELKGYVLTLIENHIEGSLKDGGK